MCNVRVGSFCLSLVGVVGMVGMVGVVGMVGMVLKNV